MSSYHHGNLRAALVEASVGLARAKGPDGVVLREAARLTGVSHNAAYRHFADRDELLREVGEVALDELAAAMTAKVRRVRAADPQERARRRLRATGQAYVEYALAEPGLFLIGFNECTFDQLTGPYDLLSAALDECVASGYMSPEKRPGAELACWSGVHGFAMLYGTGALRIATRKQREADLAVVLDRLDDAMRANG